MDEPKTLAEQFKAVMDGPDCDCLGCQLRRHIEAEGGLKFPAGVPVLVPASALLKLMNKPPVDESPAIPKHPPVRRSLLRRLLDWIIRKLR